MINPFHVVQHQLSLPLILREGEILISSGVGYEILILRCVCPPCGERCHCTKCSMSLIAGATEHIEGRILYFVELAFLQTQATSLAIDTLVHENMCCFRKCILPLQHHS